MSTKIIRKAFETRLATYATSAGVTIAYENVNFDRNVTSFFEVIILPGQTTSQYLAQTDRSYIGIAQINIHIPLNTGSGNAYNYAQSIASLYNVNIVQDSLRVYTQPMYELPAQKTDTHFVLPVRIPYRCEVA